MIKKTSTLLMAFLIFFTSLSFNAFANKVELIKNGGFEALNADGTPESWRVVGEDTHWETISDAKSGKVAIKFANDTENVTLIQTIDGIIGGSEYVLTSYLKGVKYTGKAQIKLEFYENDKSISDLKQDQSDISKDYKPWVITFNAPAGATKVNVLIRLLGGGEIHWDDVSLKGSATILPKAGEKVDFIRNGGFEGINADETPESWTFITGTVLNENCEITAGKEGNGLRMYSDTENITLSQGINGLMEKTEYIFTAFLKIDKIVGSGAQVKIEIYSGDTYISEVKQNFTDISREFKPNVITFTAPEGATRANILIRLLGGGDISWDNISLTGQMAEIDVPPPPVQEEPKEPVAAPAEPIVNEEEEEMLVGRENLLQHGDFELDSVEGHGPWGWKAVGTGDVWKDNAYVSWSEEKVHSGKKSVKVSNTDPSQNPWAMQTVAVNPGAEYQLGGYIYSDTPSTNNVGEGHITIKLEFYKDKTGSEGFVGEGRLGMYAGTDGQWKAIAHSFTVPDGANLVSIYLRQMRVGTVYFDDFMLVNTVEATRLSVLTEETFYYSDILGDTTAKAVLNTGVYPELMGSPVTMRLKYGDTVLFEKENIEAVNGEAVLKYDLSLLTEKNQEYTIEAVCGEFVETAPVYKYDRPLYLGADGVYRKNGKVINPIFAYRYRDWMYESVLPGNINVAQISLDTKYQSHDMVDKQVEYVKAQLDAAEEAGVMCLIAMYLGAKPAGGIENRANTEYIVAALKDHPAVFGWMTMDEPHNHLPNPDDVLRESYIAVRNNDPYHPVFLCEAMPKWKEAARYTDILCIDPYPGNHSAPEKFVADRVLAALEAIDYKRPVYSLLQAILFQGYFPTGDEMRNMMYQSFLAGATAVGFYKLDDAIDETKTDLLDTEVWPYIMDFGKNESVDAFDAFVHKKYPIFNEYRGKDDMWYSSYVKENTLYMVVLNRTDSAKTVSVPLTGYNGTTIGDFTAEVVAGAEIKTISGNGTLNADLPVSGAVFYKITPSDIGALSNLKNTRFDDLYPYTWAREQIIALDDMGIVNSISERAFVPGRSITRGDFAYFLIRTLGLSGETAENFADVNINAHYAREIAIGKSLGILKGVGDDKFNPDTEISRQDMMVICARGMRLVSKLGEEASQEVIDEFSDKASIADYAMADIAVMVKEEIIKGNPDKTINSLGNTTRAEAAVIMHRILQK